MRNLREPLNRSRPNVAGLVATALALIVIAAVSATTISWKSGYFAGRSVQAALVK